MMEFFKGKNYLYMVSTALSVIMAIAYTMFTSPYGLFNGIAAGCLVIAVLTSGVIVVLETKIDSYLQIIGTIAASLAASLFLKDCVGTINDYLNDVVFMGSGAPIQGVIAIAVGMLVLMIIEIIGCFSKK